MLEFRLVSHLRSPGHKTVADIPMLDLSRQYASIRGEILAAVERACDSQRYILGDEVTAFEGEFASLCGTAESVACSSGTDALWLALTATGIKSGDAVITTPFSFFASASSIVRAGARPVFADIDPETLNLDPAKVRESLKTSSAGRHALLPVHLYGQCADMDALDRIAGEFKLHVIEDAAQAVGATWKGKPAGALGLAAAFSFYPTKNLSAFGDAGALTTSDPGIAEHARSLRSHGAKQRYYHDEIGANSRMDSVQAAVLRVKMPHLPQWNKARRQRARNYDRLLSAAGLTKTGANSPGLPERTRGRLGDLLPGSLAPAKMLRLPRLRPGRSAGSRARRRRSAGPAYVCRAGRRRAEMRGGGNRGVLFLGAKPPTFSTQATRKTARRSPERPRRQQQPAVTTANHRGSSCPEPGASCWPASPGTLLRTPLPRSGA